MADFTSGFWSWFIGIVTVVSIVVLLYFTVKFSGGIKAPGEKAETMGHVWDENLEELNTPLPRWWRNLFIITLIWGLAYLFLYPGLGSFAGYLGWTQEGQYEKEMQQAEERYGPIYNQYLNTGLSELVTDQEALTIGKRLFSTYCTTCHGSDAGGARGYPNLRDDDWLYGGKPETIKNTILNGRQGIMPPWEEILTEKEIFSVAEYIRTLAGHSADSNIAARGREIFNTNCTICHGADGTGNQQLGAPNLADDIWLYGGSQKRIIESIAKGRSGNMPSHKEFLGEAKAHLLAAYVYSLSHR